MSKVYESYSKLNYLFNKTKVNSFGILISKFMIDKLKVCPDMNRSAFTQISNLNSILKELER